MINEKKLPLITIIINNYNNYRYIEKAILSAINQTYNNLQIIIWDDCSIENRVKKIYKKYQEIDSRVEVYYNKKNLNIYTSRLNAIDYIKGEYVAFMDGDDSYNFDFIRHMYYFLKYKNADIVVCSFLYVIENNKFIDSRNQFNKLEYNRDEEEIINFIFDNQAATFAQNLTWNKLYKTELLFKAKNKILEKNISNLRLYAGEDFFINLFIMSFANRLCIDEKFIGNNYRRTEALEIKKYSKKISYINCSHYTYKLVYELFLKDIKDKEKSKLFSNFKNTVIITFSQYLYLFKLDINIMDLDKMKYYLNINDENEMKIIKQKILLNSNQWLIPFTMKYSDEIDELKKRIINANKITFNLNEGIFYYIQKNDVFVNELAFINSKLFDLLLLAIHLNKNISIVFNKLNHINYFLKSKLMNILKKNNLNEININFIELDYSIEFNLQIDKYQIKKYFLESIWNKSKFNNFINDKVQDIELVEDIKNIFKISYLITNVDNNFYSRSIFNYSYTLYFCLFISLKKEFSSNNISNSSNIKNIILDIYNEQIHVYYDTFFKFLNNISQVKSYLFIKILNIAFPKLLNVKFANFMYNLFFDNLSYWYEATTVIPKYLLLNEDGTDKLEILKLWQNQSNKKNKFKNYNYGIYKIPFVNKIIYLLTDQNIFNNEMYKFMRNHNNLFKLFWLLNKKHIKKD